MANPIALGTLVHNRYYLLRALRPLEFGWLYSAVDRKRNNHLCWIEELTVPTSVLPDLEALRQALQQQIRSLGTLHHPQVMLPTVAILDRPQLFLIQPYCEGISYREVLAQRPQPMGFSEAEVIQFLQQVLSILSAIHTQGWGHHNLTLDSILQQQPEPQTDPQVALVHLGVLRDILLDWGFESLHPRPPALRSPRIPDRDLFDLATIALQLLTGNVHLASTPNAIPPLLSDKACTQLGISPRLARVLRRMRSRQPRVRYPSAQAVLDALAAPDRPSLAGFSATRPTTIPATILPPPTPSPPHTIPSKPPRRRAPLPTPSIEPIEPPIPFWQDRSLMLLSVIFIVFSGIAIHRIGRAVLPRILPLLPSIGQPTKPSPQPSSSEAIAPVGSQTTAPTPATSNPVSPTLRSQLQTLGISIDLFMACVDELAGSQPQHPPPDRQAERWQTLATTLIQKLTQLSDEARQGMGTYRRSSLDGWLAELQTLSVSSQTLTVLADHQFFTWFPGQQDRALNPRQLGQVWYAIALDQLRRSPDWLIPVPANLPKFEHQAKLEAGQSKVYQITQSAGNVLQMQLQAASNPPRFSIVQGQTVLARQAPDKQWSAILSRSGRYEIIVSSPKDTRYTITLPSLPSRKSG